MCWNVFYRRSTQSKVPLGSPVDPMELCLVSSGSINDENVEIAEYAQQLKDTLFIPSKEATVEKLEPREKRLSFDEKLAPKVELKPLPSTLRYEFLSPKATYPVIVNAKLTPQECDKLLDELRLHRKVIRYCIDDLQGLHPSFCMHRIYTEDEHNPVAQPQRRLNPTLKKVVIKEVLKLLDTGIIYPISDSKWVSPVQVVSKKGG